MIVQHDACRNVFGNTAPKRIVSLVLRVTRLLLRNIITSQVVAGCYPLSDNEQKDDVIKLESTQKMTVLY